MQGPARIEFASLLMCGHCCGIYQIITRLGSTLAGPSATDSSTDGTAETRT